MAIFQPLIYPISHFEHFGNQTWAHPKNACAKCGALDWQAKSVLVVTCALEVIWHVQIQPS